MNLFRTSTQRTRFFRFFAALVWGGGFVALPLFASALSIGDVFDRMNTTASTIRTAIFTTSGTALVDVNDTLTRANDTLTARILTTASAIDTRATAARTALTRDTAATLATFTTTARDLATTAQNTSLPSTTNLALSLEGLKTSIVCFFTDCAPATTTPPAPLAPRAPQAPTAPQPVRVTTTPPAPKPTAVTPVVTQPLTQPFTIATPQPEVVTKVIQTTVLGTADTTLDAKLASLRAELLAELSRVRQTTSNNYQAISISNRIDSLTDATLVNPTIRNAVITGTTLGATSGSFSGTLSVGGTGTSTFASDVAFDTDTLYVDSLNNRVGIGTSSPSDTLALNGALYLAQISAPSVTTNRLYNQSGSLYWNGTALGSGGGGGGGTFATTTSQVSGRLINYPLNATDILTVGASSTTTAPFFFDPNTTTGYVSGNLGIGTTSPYAKLSVVGEVVASHFTATSTTATSTFGGTLFATNGGNVGIGTTSPYTSLSVAGRGVFSYDDVWGYTGLMVQNTSGIGAIMISAPQDTPATLRFGTDGVRRWGIRKTSSSENGSNTGADFQIESFDDNGDHYQFPIGIRRSTGDVILSPTASTVNPYARLDIRGAGSGTGQLLEIANSASTTLMRLLDNGTGYFVGNVGLGTTSPYAKLSVVGEVVASHFTATSTTATSTFSGALGIGSTSPFAKLSVTGGSVLFDGTTGATPTSGGGSRFMWVPSKYALRAGGVASTRWDDANIGNYSVALGYNSIASGVSSFAVGDANQATGANAMALGITSNATGDNSFAGGNGSSASGTNAVALGRGQAASGVSALALGGRNNTASADYSIALGTYVRSSHQGSLALGFGVDSSNLMTTTETNQFALGFGGTTPQLVLNGTTGNVGIGTTSPYAKLSVVGEVVASHFTATSTTATSTFNGRVILTGTGLEEYSGNGELLLLNVDNAINVTGPGNAFGHFRLRSDTEHVRAVIDAGTGGCGQNACLATLSFAQSGSLRWGVRKSGGTESAGTNVASNFQIQSFDDDGNHYGYPFMIERATGNVLIGLPSATSLPYARFDVRSAGSGTNQLVEFSNSASTTVMRILDNGTGYFVGNIGIGTTSPYAKLSVVGNVVADAFVATSTTATSTIAGGFRVDSGTFSVDYSANTVGIGATPVATGKLKVGGAGFFISESNAFGSGSPYTSLLLGDASPVAGGALFAFYDSTVTSRPFVGLSGYNNGSDRGIYLGGGGWNASDVNSIYFYTDSSYSSSADDDGGSLRMRIFPNGGIGMGSAIADANNDGLLNLTGAGTDTDIVFSDIVTARYTLGYDVSDTAFKISGSDTLGTSDFFTVDTTGYVGIGTTSPYAKLSVVGNVVADAFVATSTTATSTFAGGLDVGSGGLTYLPSSGYVGFGTSTPFERITLIDDADPGIYIGASSVNQPQSGKIVFGEYRYPQFHLLYNGQYNRFDFADASSVAIFSIDRDSRNLGIGTTSPYAKLSVVGETVSSYFTATSTTATSTIAGGFVVDTATLFVNPYTNRVGIGTTSPTGTFEVQSPGSGVVPLYVRAGDAASNLQNWVNTSGDIVTSIDYTGGISANVQGTGYSVIGAAPLDFGYTTTADRLVVSKENNAASAGRALTSVLDYTYAGGSSATANSALNGFVYYQSSQNLTASAATAGGGLTGGRYLIRLGSSATAGTPTISFATGVSAGYADTSGGGTVPTITEFANFHAESLNSNQTTFGTTTGFWMRNPSLSISATAANVVGLRVDELTAGTNNYAIYTAGATKSYFGGNVGIGTTTPVSTLSVQGSLCVRDTGSCGTTAGTIYATTAAITDIDLAENYPTNDRTLSAGEIVAIDTTDTAPEAGVVRAAQGATVLGIVSTAPGLLLGKEFSDSIPVALSGRVPVKVSLEGGAIHKGDRITLSSTPGVGKKATTSAYTVGIALDTFNESSEKDANGVGKVLVFVNLAWSRIDPAVADGSLLATTGTTGSAQSVTGSAFWNFDDTNGRLNFVTPINLNNFDIIGVRAIRSFTNQWSIDEGGRLVVQEVKTNKLCVGETCVDEPILKRILDFVGVDAVSEIVNEAVQETTPDPVPSEPNDEPSSSEVQPEPESPSDANNESTTPAGDDPAAQSEEVTAPVVEEEPIVAPEPAPVEEPVPSEPDVTAHE